MKKLRMLGIGAMLYLLRIQANRVVFASTIDASVEKVEIATDNRLLFVLTSTIALFIVLSVFLIVNVRKRAKAEKATVVMNQKLKDSYTELENALLEVTSTKNALYVKYKELKVSKDKVKHMAYTDYLTGLPNRVAFMERLDSVMLTLRHGEVIGILDIDIDNFKDINDTLGHSYGDEMLIDVMHRLEELQQPSDYLARIGGDEFSIIIQNVVDGSEFQKRITDIQKAFSYPFSIATKEYFATVSIGVAMAPKDGKTTLNLIKNMNSAMYVSKENGKNNYCYFDDSINIKMVQKLEMQSEMRRAIEDNEFVVHYQPQIDLLTDRIIGFEALARWQHPSKGIIAPLDFIPLAEENGMIVAIGKKILKEACYQLKNWQVMGKDSLVMAVNLSARQFKDKDFLAMVYEILQDTEVDPHFLEFEITESVALDDLEFTIQTIAKLKETGITFALDDFGTGYSSLNYLKLLPVSNLKIDKSFLDTILVSDSDQKIVHTMIDLAKHLNIRVIAEGVELIEQETFLKDIECNLAQGYYYSKPVPMNLAFEVLNKMNHSNYQSR